MMGDCAKRRCLYRSVDPRPGSIVDPFLVLEAPGHPRVAPAPPLIVLCALTGIVQARQDVCGTIIYSAGEFRTYSIAQLVTPIIRLGIVSAILLARVPITASLLLLNDLLTVTVSWLYSKFQVEAL